MREWAVIVSVALFFVYEYRYKRLPLFFGALEGKYILPSPTTGTL